MMWLPIIGLIATSEVEGSLAEPFQTQAITPAPPTSALDEPYVVDDVEVRGRRGRALVPAEIELSGIEIDAFGAWDVGEVIQRMLETYGAGNAPLVLVNGKKISNAAAFTSFPPDALVRAEILPAEASSLYGGSPSQRVINLVLKNQYLSHDGRLVAGKPTQGGMSSLAAEMRRSSISGENTLQIAARLSRDTALRAEERERDRPDTSSIRPAVDHSALNLSATIPLRDWSSSLTLNGQTRRSTGRLRIGDQLVDHLRQQDSAGGTVGISGTALGWQVQVNANGHISRSSEVGLGQIDSQQRIWGVSASLGRTAFADRSVPVTANFNTSFSEIQSDLSRGDNPSTTRFDTWETRVSLSVPLSSPSRTLAGLGELTATLGGSLRDSGSSDGDEVNLAINWKPIQKLRLNGFWSASSDSVAGNLMSEPLYNDLPRVVFDFRTGQAVEIIPLLGGNPDLTQPSSERFSVTASMGPFTRWGIQAVLGYQRDISTNSVASLPDVTEDIESVYPERFVRDADGKLISVDYRPLNVGSNVTEGLNTNVTFNLPRSSGGARTANIFRVSLNHSYRVKSLLSLTKGLPELDRLQGDGGGIPSHDARLIIDARKGVLGLNLTSRWQGGYRTRQLKGTNSDRDLIVDDLATVDLTLSYHMNAPFRNGSPPGEVPNRHSSGFQINLQITNLFDTRPSAALGNGDAAPGYGRDYQDPIGRTFRLSLQRRF